MTSADPDGTKARRVRSYDPYWVENFILDRLAKAKAKGTPYQSIYLDDDTMNLAEPHTLAISKVMGRIGLPWSAMCRADTISRDVWKYMKEQGCTGVKIGFESGSQKVIDTIINKKLNLLDAAATARYLRSIGLTVHGTFTVGLPGETDAQKEETLEFIRSLVGSGAIDTFQLSGTATIEGTPLAAIAAGAHLSRYPGATSEGFAVTGDGQRKIETMKK
jgi:radical SAM superfamily enzyme YgiQ (UPF0313 family)